MANGQEFKKYIEELPNKPDVICIQESWLKINLEFKIYGYVSIRHDRSEGIGGGCVTFIQEGISFREIEKGSNQEYIVIMVWIKGVELIIINYYNPCRKLDIDKIRQIKGIYERRVIICGDFNAHSPLWGGERIDENGRVIEILLEEMNMVCINDGRGTRVDLHRGKVSELDLTLVSRSLGDMCNWEVWEESTLGSDHFPVSSQLIWKGKKEERGRIEKWIFSKAQWGMFMYLCNVESMEVDLNEEVEEIDKKIREIIIKVARKTIPQNKGSMKRRAVPWWTNECSEAVRERNRTFKQLKKTHNIQNLIKYKKAQAIVRKTIKEAKKQSWRKYCSKIGRSTPIEEIWGMIKSMRGIKKEWQYPVLKAGEETAITEKEKAEMIARELIKIHSSSNLTENGKRGRERTKEGYPSIDEERESTDNAMEALFSIGELKRALGTFGATAPGKDNICYEMLKHLDVLALGKLLGLYNKVWEEGKLPSSWKEAIIIPIKKPGKDAVDPSNYRPIALTSHIGKVMERMITERLTHYVESRGIISMYQSGFRRGRSTMDPIISLETEIRKAQVNKEVVAAVFIDIEKAYDMVWKEGVLINLDKLGITGRMFKWVKDFLFGRTIQVRIGSAFSGKYVVENGTPQGSVISPILFTIMINDIFSHVQSDIGRSLFADDGALWKRGRNVAHVKQRIQEAINLVEEWSYSWGFKLSVEKTKVVLFTKKKIIDNIEVKMYEQKLEQVKSFKFLGMWLDTKLTWIEHINRIVDKCKKIINIMRCLTGRDWGASRNGLRKINIALIRSVLDYGCFIYGRASKTALQKIEVVQAQALRICSGAYKTTPIAALHVEMGEVPLRLRRKQLMMNYWINLQGQSENGNPAKSVLNPSWEYEKDQKKFFGWDSVEVAKEMGLNNKGFNVSRPVAVTPPWLFPVAFMDLNLLDRSSDYKNIANMSGMIEERIKTIYHEYTAIYTDGSKKMDTGKTGFGVFIPEVGVSIKKRTTDHLSIYTVELMAIITALYWIEESGLKKAVICSDSSSALMSIKALSSQYRQDCIYEIYEILFRLQRNTVIVFMWVPAHIGVKGNEAADVLAKEACDIDEIMEILYSKSEVKAIVRNNIIKEWQYNWDREITGRHYYRIQKKVGNRRKCKGDNKTEGIITRLRMGHSGLNKTLHLIGKHPTGLCDHCQEEESVEHILCHCPKYITEREILKEEAKEQGQVGINIADMLNGHNNRSVLHFLRITGLINRI